MTAPPHTTRTAVLADALAADVPVALLSVGASEAGTALVAAHSGASAAADGAWEALAGACGLALGIVRDPALGPLLVVGAGGILVEIFSERPVLRAPDGGASPGRRCEPRTAVPTLGGVWR